MAVAFDGTRVPDVGKAMPCGGTPLWDWQSQCGYRCDTCNAVIGSMAMPDRCREMRDTTHPTKGGDQ